MAADTGATPVAARFEDGFMTLLKRNQQVPPC